MLYEIWIDSEADNKLMAGSRAAAAMGKEGRP